MTGKNLLSFHYFQDLRFSKDNICYHLESVMCRKKHCDVIYIKKKFYHGLKIVTRKNLPCEKKTNAKGGGQQSKVCLLLIAYSIVYYKKKKCLSCFLHVLKPKIVEGVGWLKGKEKTVLFREMNHVNNILSYHENTKR